MSQHKTGLSNWMAEEKKLYRERREKGLRGQTGAVTVHQTIKDEKGNEERIPLGNKIGRRLSWMGQIGNTWQAARGPQQVHMQKQRKASSRGD